MLVLSRKKSERIVIAQNILITVVEIRPGLVRLGIDAPREVPILREELTTKIKESQCTMPSST